MKMKLLTATLLSALLAMPAYAEEDAPSMADMMHDPHAMSLSGPMHGSPAHSGDDCDSIHGGAPMHGHGMMGSKGDDCDSKHGNMGKGDDCDSKHGHMGKGDDDSEHGGMGKLHAYADTGHGMPGHGMGGAPGMKGGTMMLMQLDTHLLGGLDLTDAQQAKVTHIADQLKHDNWITQGKINDESAKLRDLYQAERRDPSAIGREYSRIFDLKREMIETYLKAENRVEDVLDADQLEIMRAMRGAIRQMYGM